MAFTIDGKEITDFEMGRIMVLAGRFGMEQIGQLLMLSGQKMKNPSKEFDRRAKAGDFDELRPDEDPEELAPGREPMADDEYMEARANVMAQGELFWQGSAEPSMLQVLWNLTGGFDADRVGRLCAIAADDARGMLVTLLPGEAVVSAEDAAGCHMDCAACGDRACPGYMLYELEAAGHSVAGAAPQEQECESYEYVAPDDLLGPEEEIDPYACGCPDAEFLTGGEEGCCDFCVPAGATCVPCEEEACEFPEGACAEFGSFTVSDEEAAEAEAFFEDAEEFE